MELKLSKVSDILTVDAFKRYFMEFPYQPYPTWTVTTWAIGEYCIYGGLYYVSKVAKNALVPTGGLGWDLATDLWAVGNTYSTETIVYYSGNFYLALEENTGEQPSISDSWKLLTQTDLDDIFSNARPWVAPVAYDNGAKVIYFNPITYKQVVMASQNADNYDSPAESTWTESIDDDSAEWFSDVQISRAMDEANFKCNMGLFPDGKVQIIASYLTAFFLLYDRSMSLSALNGGSSSSGPVKYRSVGKMAVSYAESKLFAKFPSYEFLASNDYGKKAFNLMLPYLRGNIVQIDGAAGPY